MSRDSRELHDSSEFKNLRVEVRDPDLPRFFKGRFHDTIPTAELNKIII